MIPGELLFLLVGVFFGCYIKDRNLTLYRSKRFKIKKNYGLFWVLESGLFCWKEIGGYQSWEEAERVMHEQYQKSNRLED